MMRRVRIAIGVVLLAGALFLGVGLLLPARFHVERSAQINAQPQQVYELVAAPRQWARWTVWNRRDPNMVITYSGPPSGAQAAWSWKSATQGNGEMTFTDAQAPSRIAYALFFADFGMRSQGVVSLEAVDGGTRVRWTNDGDMGLNPVNRWFGLAMDRLVGPDFESGLAALKVLAERPTP